MRFVLNSDILYTTRLVHRRLPQHLEQFARECARAGAIVVFPRTVLLEAERRQSHLLETACAELTKAYELLRDAGVQCSEITPTELYGMPSFPELFAQCGATTEIEDPTIEDYTEAARRACLHLAPQSQTAEADEMRDLVIWMVSMRIARRDGGAILVSRDEVHTHERGNEEAASANLFRAKHVAEALEILGVEGAPGALVRMLLVPLWNDLRDAGLPLSETPSIRLISNVSFVQGETGVALARFDFRARTDSGRDLRASAEVHRTGEVVSRVIVTEINVDGQKWGAGKIEKQPNRHIRLPGTSADERLEALREIIGESE